MITANLQLCVTFFAFLLSRDSWAGEDASFFKNMIYLTVCIFLSLYPIFVMWLLVRNYLKLETEETNKKLKAIYQGIKPDNMKAIFYTPVFHIRRILIVTSSIYFSKNVILTSFVKDQHFFKILSFMLI